MEFSYSYDEPGLYPGEKKLAILRELEEWANDLDSRFYIRNDYYNRICILDRKNRLVFRFSSYADISILRDATKVLPTHWIHMSVQLAMGIEELEK